MSRVLDLFYIDVERAYLNAIEFEVELHSHYDNLLGRLDDDLAVYVLHDRDSKRTRLDIRDLTDEQCKLLFRLTYVQLQNIVSTMKLDETVSFELESSRTFSCSSVEALAIMLRRFAYTSRLFDLQMLFGIDVSTIGIVFDSMIKIVYIKYRDGIRYNKNHLHSFNLRNFNAAIVEKGSCYREVAAFIDGTLDAAYRPEEAQVAVKNGHGQQLDGLKYQTIVTPDGITVSLCGPFFGSIYDKNMIDSGNILTELEEELGRRSTGSQQYAIYGDAAHEESDIFTPPIPSTQARTTDERELNQRMATVSECVKWEFNHISTLWGFLKFQQQKLRLSQIGLYYVVGTLMKNIHICINRESQTSRFFEIMVPTLEEYMAEMSS